MAFHRTIPIPEKVSKGKPIRADDLNKIIGALGALAHEIDLNRLRESPDIGVRSRNTQGTTAWVKKPSTGGTATELRFQFGGISKNADEQWVVRVGLGAVIYNEIRDASLFDDSWDSPKIKKVTTVYPTVRVGNADVPLDASPRPAPLLGERAAATVWLVCQDALGPSRLDHARLVVSDREKLPPGERGEVCIPIADFDVETTGSGEAISKRAVNVSTWLQSDHQQPYLLDDTDDMSDSYGSDEGSYPPDSTDTSLSGGGGTSMGGSGSGSEEVEVEGCNIKARAWWASGSEGLPTCLTARPDGPKCIPAEMTLGLSVAFFRSMVPGFGEKDCTAWAFAAELVGAEPMPNPPAGSTYPQAHAWGGTWGAGRQKYLTFKLKNPMPCAQMYVAWNVKSFPAPSGPLTGGEFPCCNKEWSGMIPIQAYPDGPLKPLPKVCGKCPGCSSSVI